MTVVIDASTCIAALVDNGPEGRWAESLLIRTPLVAPQLILVESSNVLRRLTTSGRLSDLEASTAHRDLMTLAVDLFPFEPLSDRVWALRFNLSSYDAWYVALAEALDAPLATLDQRLINAPGPRCEFISLSAEERF